MNQALIAEVDRFREIDNTYGHTRQSASSRHLPSTSQSPTYSARKVQEG